jgi:predicted neutral ceramidase superfamily lipid hydrolase
VAQQATGGVGGTVGAFNFIRRVGFPSTPEVLSVFLTIALLASVLSLPLAGISLQATILFPLIGVVIPTIVGEALNSTTILRGDKVLNFRRLIGLEILSWFLLIVALPLGAIAGTAGSNTSLWVDGFFAVLALSLPIRFLTIASISSVSSWRKFVASALPPILSIRSFSVFGPRVGLTNVDSGLILHGTAAVLVGIVLATAGISRIIRNVEHSGTPEVRDSPMTLFRVFLQHWLRSDPEPLEKRLGTLGTQGTIEGSILGFSGTKGAVGSVVVSNFHPGPYRDLGSAGLPSKLKASIERSKGGVAQVPHGISNHQLNIVSQTDVQRVIDTALEEYPTATPIHESSAMVRSTVDEAKVSGQAFGNVAFLTLTLSPTDMEDLPSKVAHEIEREALARGLTVIIADAHNSLSNQTSITSEQARKLVEASVKVLDQLALARRSPFRAGSAADPLEEFRLEDGIGPGGLSSLVVRSGSQIVAYLTIDGNNMHTGVREAILEDLETIGVADGEIMTTDTHLVTGLVRSTLGYYPVGAHLDVGLLKQKVRETVHRAISSMEESTAGFSKFSIEVRVLGSETFQTITSFVGRIARHIGRQFFRLEALTLVVTLIILFFP